MKTLERLRDLAPLQYKNVQMLLEKDELGTNVTNSVLFTKSGKLTI